MLHRSVWSLTTALVLTFLMTTEVRSQGKPVAASIGAASSVQLAENTRLFVLSIGINAYPGEDRLRYATRDAKELVQVLKQKAGRSFHAVETRLLTDKDADREHILQGFTWLQQEVTSRDLAVIFYSGHGSKGPKGGFFMVPFGFRDAQPRETMVSGKELKAAAAVRGPTLVLLDCCFAGAVLNESGKGGAKRGSAAAERPGPVYLCASRGREMSDESDKLKHGTFTKALLEALSGKADANQDGAVSLGEVETYVRKRVRQLSGDEQHLVVGGTSVSRSITLTRP